MCELLCPGLCYGAEVESQPSSVNWLETCGLAGDSCRYGGNYFAVYLLDLHSGMDTQGGGMIIDVRNGLQRLRVVGCCTFDVDGHSNTIVLHGCGREAAVQDDAYLNQ